MENAITRLLILLFTVCTYAQQGINYKAIIKDDIGNVIADDVIPVQFIILDGTANVYEELHTPSTDSNGIIIINIGEGIPIGVSHFSTVDWSSNNHFLNVKINSGSGLQDMGTTAFKTVPYAIHAKTAESVTSTCGLSIGDTYQGGIIFYLDPSGCNGLIAAPSDQSTGIDWSNGTDTNTTAFASCAGCGDGNTNMIVFNQGDTGSYAARICRELSLGGETDWYLPSEYELNLMYKNIGRGNVLGLGNIGGFTNSVYWSSTEYDIDSAWGLDFTFGSPQVGTKSFSKDVRAVRPF